jgi:hypothetical protein
VTNPTADRQMEEPASTRSMRSFARAHIEGMLRRARKDYVVPGSKAARQIDALAEDVANNELRHGPASEEAHEARLELEKVLTAVENDYVAPAKALEEHLLLQALDDHLTGKTPDAAYNGDYLVRRHLNDWGEYVEDAEVAGYTRTKVILEAAAVEEMQAIHQAIRKAVPGSPQHAAAEAKLEEFFVAHNLAVPEPQPDYTINEKT